MKYKNLDKYCPIDSIVVTLSIFPFKTVFSLSDLNNLPLRQSYADIFLCYLLEVFLFYLLYLNFISVCGLI